MDDESVLNSVLVKRKVSRSVGCSKDQKRSFRRKRVEITRLTMALFIYKLFQDMSGDQQWKRVIKSKEEQERIRIACHIASTFSLFCSHKVLINVWSQAMQT